MYCNNSAEKWWAWAISDGWPWHFEELKDRRKGQRCGFGGPDDDSGILFFVIRVKVGTKASRGGEGGLQSTCSHGGGIAGLLSALQT